MNPLPTLRMACTAILSTTLLCAQAQSTAPLPLRSLAATCAACHGTDGEAVAGAGLIGLNGRDKADLIAQLTAFRSGARPATVMQQIAKGYTPEQIEQLAAYFASLK